MPNSSDFEDLRVSPRGVLLYVGHLITEIAENPSSGLTTKQRTGREPFARYGESLYNGAGVEGIAAMNDDDVAACLDKAFTVLRDVRQRDGNRISRSHKRRIDSACNAILTRLAWLKNGVHSIAANELTHSDFIRMVDGTEIEFDPIKHSYLTAKTLQNDFNGQGLTTTNAQGVAIEHDELGDSAIVMDASDNPAPTPKTKRRRTTRKPGKQPK